ncbi:TIGR01841 family phasin [Roseomonas hellenica]|uniref:TIGR01841 family phasin n=1 Tax=Plastoroseomonas hellenica TaxID=2687306 RepID=A0ABS5F7B4_9PROT|nr:TIGR01841 family phasin [Plastoroseomonas hellenica]MBR0668416.1 TIGR01841 family phasin [Plastoroseomonas hellenica]
MSSSSNSPKPDVTRLFGDFRFPAMPDLEALAGAQRRNLDALSAANRVALEGAQAVAKRHMEILQQSVGELSEAMRKLAEVEAPQARAERQAEVVRITYERAVANMRELAELIQKSSTEALSLLNHRFAEAMEEAKALTQPKTDG